MPVMELTNEVVLTKDQVKKLYYLIDAVGSTMDEENDEMKITFFGNTLVVETNGIVSAIKLENE